MTREIDAQGALPSSPWIACEDRYPDDGRDVLAFGKFGYEVACFERGSEDDPCWWCGMHGVAFKESVTHWMELPPKPEGANP